MRLLKKPRRPIFWTGLPPPHGSRPHMTHLSQHLDIGVFFLEDPGEFCQQTQVLFSVMFLNVHHIFKNS